MAGVMPAVRLAEPLNQFVRRVYDDGAGLPAEVLPLCQQVADMVGQMIEAVRAGERIEVPVDDVAEQLGEHFSEYVLRAEAAEPEVAEVGDAPADAIDAAAEEIVDDAQEVSEAESEAPQPTDQIEIDPEIAEIFSEEATEILERCDEIVEVWRADPTAPALIEELQRQLHTLKGGARLAGLTVLGDLSHELETLIGDLGSGQLPATEDAFELVQRSLDELHRLRDAVQAGIDTADDTGITEGLAADLQAASRDGEPLQVEPEAAEETATAQIAPLEEAEAPDVTAAEEVAESQDERALAADVLLPESEAPASETHEAIAEEAPVGDETTDGEERAPWTPAAAAPESSVRIPVDSIGRQAASNEAGVRTPEWMPPAAAASQLVATYQPAELPVEEQHVVATEPEQVVAAEPEQAVAAEPVAEPEPEPAAAPEAKAEQEEPVVPPPETAPAEEMQVTTPALSP
jgi:chemosensory pili system protein ChpA (sensor histidine kinase/response regulator)